MILNISRFPELFVFQDFSLVALYKQIICRMTAKKRRYNRIKIVLYEKEKSNKWLAEKLAVKPVTVSKWCTNDNQPTISTLFKIAEVLNVEVCELLAAK